MGTTVLVVDDDEDVRDGLMGALADEGYGVLTASNGVDALDVLHGDARPDVILLDLTMPVMDGYAFRKRQLEDDALRAIPVICCSADARAMLPGPGVWRLRKPFDVEQLLAVVARAVARVT